MYICNYIYVVTLYLSQQQQKREKMVLNFLSSSQCTAKFALWHNLLCNYFVIALYLKKFTCEFSKKTLAIAILIQQPLHLSHILIQ